MLYDKRWDAKVQTTPSLEGLIAWLETQPGKRTFDFHNQCGECLVGQYMAHLGIAWSMEEYRSVVDQIFGGDILHGYYVLVMSPSTIGAALTRAREAARR